MSPELFDNDFHLWLEANGVVFTGKIEVPFETTVDLNKLKAGIAELLKHRQESGWESKRDPSSTTQSSEERAYRYDGPRSFGFGRGPGVVKA